MPAGKTYDTIATTTLTTATASVTFSSISGSYTDLVLVSFAAHTADSSSGDIQLTFNSDGGNNYSSTELYGNGSSNLSSSQSNKGFIKWTYGAINLRPMVKANIMNYSNTATYKTVLIRDELATNVTSSRVGLWRSTSAITSVKVENPGSSFTSGSIFTLYGITAA